MNQELKVLLKEHKGIKVKNMKTWTHDPLGLLKMRENCVTLSEFETRTLRLEVLHLTTRLKLQNGM